MTSLWREVTMVVTWFLPGVGDGGSDWDGEPGGLLGCWQCGSLISVLLKRVCSPYENPSNSTLMVCIL